MIDPTLRNLKFNESEKNAWIRDQYIHPIDSLHTIDEVLIRFENNQINFKVINFNDRPVSVTADNKEFRNIKSVEIYSSKKYSCKLLFDNNYSMEERILKEQFFS